MKRSGWKGVKVSIIAQGGVRTSFAIGTGRTEATLVGHHGTSKISKKSVSEREGHLRKKDMPALDDMNEASSVADAVVFVAQADPKSRLLMIGVRPMSEPLYGGA